MLNRQTEDKNDPVQKIDDEQEPIAIEISLEELEELLGVEFDLATEELFKTQQGDGHTYNPFHAQDQGLTYTPPTDPPVLPTDDSQGVEIAAGFALCMENSFPNAECLPPTVDNNDLDLLNDIYLALHYNSETGHLTNVKVQVNEGVVSLLGTVFSEDDIGLVHEIVRGLEGVVGIRNHLQVAEQ
jgi:hypothetical protein